MTTAVRRAGAFAAVGTLVLVLPAYGVAAAAPLALAALVGAAFVTDGPLFELFARPGDREENRLYGLLGFVLSLTGLGLLTTASILTTGDVPELPLYVYVGTVLLLVYGNLCSELVKRYRRGPFAASTGFMAGGFVASVAGQAITIWLTTGTIPTDVLPKLAFLAASGAFLGALLRALLFERDDSLVLFSVGLLLWLLSELAPQVHYQDVAAAILVTLALGYVSYALQTASVEGMLTGILLSVLTIVLGGLGWFSLLITFFGVGALATKFRYDIKKDRGVAEENDGARGTGNVLGNAAVALASVLGFAAATVELLPVDATYFLFAFAGSLSTALSDTLSSEVGAIFDDPRLVTTWQRVEPGTDGAVTWQGELAGIAGALAMGIIAIAVFPGVDPSMTVTPTGGGIVLLAGVAGMTVDSLLGATIEGAVVGNQGVNFLATLSGAIVAVAAFVLVL
ncbi:DUF92 domain-containing protein [Haloarchaeobius sp. HME9146]|uniref:DUF92 domain-containing protein n=1 Tax=Haloarchaeobius sp. HME9146 TaxID=2978732 RepID=UPI0021C0EF1B|nr:DUF92 domain-containing protein [Haloarchaeobius sp. HME9146]